MRNLLFAFLAAVVTFGSPAPASAQHVEADDARSDLEESSTLARQLFKELVCMCGGCQRETLEACKCAYAREERHKVEALLKTMDTTTKAGQEKAKTLVIEAFIKEYGGEHVLTVPRARGFNRLAWVVPYVIFAMATIMVILVGRRWVRQGKAARAAGAAGTSTVPQGDVAKLSQAERDKLEDKLDDELRDID
jgi:cytochrome c-type biogenesis protein CcmH/NrfF